jgi:hypothetical protein
MTNADTRLGMDPGSDPMRSAQLKPGPPDGKTQYCLACEAEAHAIAHRCGLPPVAERLLEAKIEALEWALKWRNDPCFGDYINDQLARLRAESPAQAKE